MAGEPSALRLEAFAASHDREILGWNLDEEGVRLWVGLNIEHPLTPEKLRKQRESFDNPTSRLFAASVDEHGGMVGTIGLRNINPHAGYARLVYVLIAPDQRGNGYGPAMVDAVLTIAFDEIGLHRVDLGVFDTNARAIRCYEKVGFVREGLAREALHLGDGTYLNMASMAILEYEWRARQG